MGKRRALPCSTASITAPPPSAEKPVRRASQPGPEPKVTIWAPARVASPLSRSNQRSSALRIAAPPGIRPSKISALALATPSSPSSKFSVCTGPTVEITAAWGRTMRDRGRISSAWFMPISNTARRVSAGMRARVRGTPMWLL